MDFNEYLDLILHIPFENQGEPGYLSVHPEMSPAVQGLSPTGRYFVYCLHPQGGSCTFIDNDFICVITDRIEKKQVIQHLNMQRKIFNPVLKETVTFIKTAAETNGAVSELEISLMPGGGNPLHYHTSYTETFTALEGELGLQLKTNRN